MNDNKFKIRIHPVFWTMLGLAVLLGDFVEVILLLVLIVVHELGHVTAALSCGWDTNTRIDLLPFGGIWHTDNFENARSNEQIFIAFAGPLCHVLLVLIGTLFYNFNLWSYDWLYYFVLCNLTLAIFNLLPIYPLDGGRVLQSVLCYFMPYRSGLIYSLLIGFLGSLGLLACSFVYAKTFVHLPLAIISLFLFWNNCQEWRHAKYKYLRFLIAREKEGISSFAQTIRIAARDTDLLSNVLLKLYKNKYNVVDVISSEGTSIGFIPEEQLLDLYFTKLKYKSPLKELI